jgi:hypothetical protein
MNAGGLSHISGDECRGLGEHIGQGGVLRGGFGGWGDGFERGGARQARLDEEQWMGFRDYQPTEGAFLDLFAELRQRKIIP